MRNIKLTIEYDGKAYLGWQRLGDSDKTIQGKLEGVLSRMTDETIEITGSGRTDAGAHAKGQVANFKTSSTMKLASMVEFLNRYLPRDIVVIKAQEAAERFHSRYNAKGKKYTYNVWTNEIPTTFNRYYSYHYPQHLDTAKMKEACELLVGEHDFLGFSSLKKSKKSTVRTIKELSIERDGSMMQITFVGDGFLYNMVRIIVGTILEVGSGKMELAEIEEIFASGIRQGAGETVPSHGLFLDEVYYN